MLSFNYWLNIIENKRLRHHNLLIRLLLNVTVHLASMPTTGFLIKYIMKTNLITPEGYRKLQQEHDHLWFEKRPEITKIVNWAASLGDRSENADYTFNKRLLRQIDRRVRYLRKRLPDLKVIEYNPQQAGKVYFGAWVEIENDDGETKYFRIVGPDEIYERNDYISIDSPMARALLGKSVDDDFMVTTPQGDAQWYINRIEYQA